MTTAILVIFATAWNHNVQPVPPEIDLSKILIGKTTIREAKIILGSNSIVHTCRGSCLYRFIPARSVFYGREAEVYVEYSNLKIESSTSAVALLGHRSPCWR